MIPESAEVRSDQPAPSVDRPPPGERIRPNCTICGDSEPHHVHDGDRRIEDYFTVGRGQSDFDAARSWKAKCHALLASSDPGSPSDGGLDVERLARIYRDHPQPSESTDYVAHERGRCHMVCWRWIETEYLSGSPSESED